MGRQNKRSRRRFKMWHAILGLGLFLLVLSHITGSYKLRKRLQELRAQGYPLAIEELNSMYTIPEGARNAADVYLAAFSYFKEWDKAGMNALSKARSPARTEPLDDSARHLLEKFLSENQKTFTLLHEAASIEHCRYPIDLTEPLNWDDPLFNNVRNCARLLYIDVLIQCDNNAPDKALASIQANLMLAGSMNIPMLDYRLTYTGLRGWAYRSIQRVLNRIQLSDEQLQNLSEWIKAPYIDEDFKRLLIAEQCLGIYTLRAPIREIASRTEYGKGILPMLIPWKMLGLCYRDTLAFIDLMQKLIDAMDLPNPQRLAAFKAVQESINTGGRGGTLTGTIWPIRTYLLNIDVRHLALLRTTQTALAVERYRMAEGRLPKSLDDIVPSCIEVIPTDPFDGHPIKYRTRETGYVVYSVGEDQTDEGGTEQGTQGRDSRGKPLPYDITFVVER
jgi:hypothetical protein